MILQGKIFAAKHSGMGNKKNNVGARVPWGWVLVSVYCTALVCVGVSQLVSQEAAVAFVKDFQTLIAGVATIAALFIAAQQLKRQADRDAVDTKRHYQTELDALAELDKTTTRLASLSAKVPDPFEPALPYDRSRWDRLRQQVHVSTSGSVSTVMKEVENYNALVTKSDTAPFQLTFSSGPDYSKQYGWERTRVHYASMLLLSAVDERRTAVLKEIETTS